MPATMNISSRMTSKLAIVSCYTASGLVMPMTTASSASSPPGCSGSHFSAIASVKMNSSINSQPAAKGLIANTMGLITRKAMISCLYYCAEWPGKFSAKARLSVVIINQFTLLYR